MSTAAFITANLALTIGLLLLVLGILMVIGIIVENKKPCHNNPKVCEWCAALCEVGKKQDNEKATNTKHLKPDTPEGYGFDDGPVF
jgi:hypothetical protein